MTRKSVTLAAIAATLSLVAAAAPASADTVDVAPVRQLYAGGGGVTTAPLALGADGRLYIAEGSDVTVLGPTANGSVPAPEKEISGFNSLNGISLGAFGAAVSDEGASSVVVFDPAQAGGAVVPTREIAGATTTLDEPVGVAWGAGGSLWVANASGGTLSLLHFPAGATGDVAPDRTISGDATGLGTLTPVLGSGVSLAGQPDGSVLLTEAGGFSPSVRIWSPAQNGNQAPARTLIVPLAGPNTLVGGVATDGAGHIYVTTGELSIAGSGTWGSISAYAADASGSAAPLVKVSGPQSGLGLPLSPAVSSNGLITLLNIRFIVTTTTLSIPFFNPLAFPSPAAPPAPAATPGAVSKLKVAKKGAKRVVSWQAASGATSYSVVITKGKKSKVVLSKTVTQTKLAVKAAKLPTGKLKVTVTASNSAGAGPAASKAFNK